MSYQDVRHHYEDPPDEADMKAKELADAKAWFKELMGISVDDLGEYGLQKKYTDGLGNWSEWETVALFRYVTDAKLYARHVQSYQHEEAPIDQCQVRVVFRGQEVPIS